VEEGYRFENRVASTTLLVPTVLSSLNLRLQFQSLILDSDKISFDMFIVSMDWMVECM